jgi:tetratricopeptide (TPR) repeat protein
MSEPVTARGEMNEMLAVFDSLAWKLTRQLDPGFSVAQETFVAASSNVRLDAFEQYIRGISEPDQQERLRHLKMAVKLSPELGQAWMALGREDYKGQQFDEAAAAFAKVGSNSPDSQEAGFYRGLSLLFSGDYPHAEEAFATVARTLPLAEVFNNQGVAVSRRKKDAIALFRQAVAADAKVADYHFNLSLALKRKGESTEALSELAQCLRLHPTDAEAQDLQDSWKAAAGSAEDQTAADPLERIARNLDASAFHQAAQLMDQLETARLAALSPHERAARQTAEAREFLNHGLLLEAERLLLMAEAEDGKLPEAHAGLAQLRERTGDQEAARKEATISLELLPSVDAYLVLARLDLDKGALETASSEVDAALKIESGSLAALEVRKQIESKQGRKQ